MPTPWGQIEPKTEPALEHLAAFVAAELNALQAESVRRWIVSPMASYRVEEYPLLQAQCLSSTGESLEECQGSIRYCLINEMIRVGDQQQLGFRYMERAIAQALRKHRDRYAGCNAPLRLKDLDKIRAEVRVGDLKGADGTSLGTITWTEIFFNYYDAADIGVSGEV